MRHKGARSLTVTTNQAANNLALLGGPLRLCGWSLQGGGSSQGLTVDQSAAAPGAGATIASISLPNGSYVVESTLELTGTPGAGDVDNVQVFIGGTLVATSVNLGAVGNYGQEEIPVLVSGGPLTLAFKAIGAATVGSTYKIEATIAAATEATATIFDGAQPLAFVSVDPGKTATTHIDDNGIQVDTKLSVQANQGSVSGVLWYYLESDLQDPDSYSPG